MRFASEGAMMLALRKFLFRLVVFARQNVASESAISTNFTATCFSKPFGGPSVCFYFWHYLLH